MIASSGSLNPKPRPDGTARIIHSAGRVPGGKGLGQLFSRAARGFHFEAGPYDQIGPPGDHPKAEDCTRKTLSYMCFSIPRVRNSWQCSCCSSQAPVLLFMRVSGTLSILPRFISASGSYSPWGPSGAFAGGLPPSGALSGADKSPWQAAGITANDNQGHCDHREDHETADVASIRV